MNYIRQHKGEYENLKIYADDEWKYIWGYAEAKVLFIKFMWNSKRFLVTLDELLCSRNTSPSFANSPQPIGHDIIFRLLSHIFLSTITMNNKRFTRKLVWYCLVLDSNVKYTWSIFRSLSPILALVPHTARFGLLIWVSSRMAMSLCAKTSQTLLLIHPCGVPTQCSQFPDAKHSLWRQYFRGAWPTPLWIAH